MYPTPSITSLANHHITRLTSARPAPRPGSLGPRPRRNTPVVDDRIHGGLVRLYGGQCTAGGPAGGPQHNTSSVGRWRAARTWKRILLMVGWRVRPSDAHCSTARRHSIAQWGSWDCFPGWRTPCVCVGGVYTQVSKRGRRQSFRRATLGLLVGTMRWKEGDSTQFGGHPGRFDGP